MAVKYFELKSYESCRFKVVQKPRFRKLKAEISLQDKNDPFAVHVLSLDIGLN